MTTASTLGYDRNVYLRQSDPAQAQGDALVIVPGTAANPGGMIAYETGVWANCPWASGLCDPGFGFMYDEPFATYDATNDWTLTQATSGSAAVSTTIPGALTLNPGAVTAHQGVNLQRKVAAFVPAANKSLWFEVTVILAAGLTTECFIGLAEVNTAIVSAGALNTINNIGWSSVTGDGVLLFNCGKGSTEGTAIAAVTLSTTVPHKLGFFYDGKADTVQQYIDGVATGAAFATTYIPKVVVYPSFVGQVTGTPQTTLTLSGLRVFQLR
jgi:hypothetical protein